MIDALPLLLGPEGYQISRSVRLRSSASAYFSATLGSGNKRTFTYSLWVKRGTLGVLQVLLGTNSGTAALPRLAFTAADQLEWFSRDSASVIQSQITTTAVYRDPSAWYHIVFAYNTTQAVAADRLSLYVNGVLQAVTITTALALNEEPNSTFPYGDALIGIQRTTSFAGPFDGYLTEVNFIDGQALTPSSFGETNTVTGVWQPKKYAGTYGTNGFYLNFSDNSAATAAAIGKDYSGNGNNWTPNNISVTAGVTYDSMLDVPTQWADGGNGRGNYCVLSPLAKSTNITVSDGNLYATSSAASYNAVLGTMAPASGKWYFEMTLNASVAAPDIGWHQSEYTSAQLTAFSTTTRDGGYCIATDGTGTANTFVFNNGTRTTVANTGWATNDVIGCAIDIDNKKIWFSRNGTWYPASVGGSAGDPANGTNQAITYTYTGLLLPRTSAYSGGYSSVVNFGQRPFTYTPPSGFKALNTLNLPTPTILKGNQYFDATTYTGTGSTQSIVNSGSMQPDLVWIKQRSTTRDHRLTDSVRGANKQLFSNTTGAETSNTDELTAFNSDGFTLSTSAGVNANAGTYVGWQWKEGATQGFDIVTYTGTGSNTTVAHNLGVAPKMIIFRARSIVENWPTWHANLTSAAYVLTLNTTNAQASVPQVMNSTAPTSSVFSVGTSTGSNGSGTTYVAYLFAEVAGFSKFGSYTGNGSADGPFVFCGFRPRFVLFKRTDSATGGEWAIYDSSRDPYNACTTELYPSNNLADTTAGGASMDIVSNGFKIRNSRLGINASGGTYIFAAFSEFPFKNSLAR